MNRFGHYIYMDHSATTPVLKEVASCVYDTMTLYFGNASEPHSLGKEANKILKNSRKIIADTLNASAEEIIFTSGGTESNNMAIFGTIEAHFRKGNHIITSDIEHPAVLMPLKILENEGYRITYVPADKYGIIDPEEIKNAILPDTILISIMHSNNIMGAIQPIEEIGKIAQKNNIIFHCDAVQSYMNIKLDVSQLNADSADDLGPQNLCSQRYWCIIYKKFHKNSSPDFWRWPGKRKEIWNRKYSRCGRDGKIS